MSDPDSRAADVTGILEQVDRAIRRITLPQLTRPDTGPMHPPGVELARFDLRAYVYCSIAYVVDLLSGLILLIAAKNVAATNLAARSLYEWTMQARYVDQRSRGPIRRRDFLECRKVIAAVQAGNSWAKRHGSKYPQIPRLRDAPDSLRIKHLVKAYKQHQLETQNEDTVDDHYGYLSEQAHPNACLLAEVTVWHGFKCNFVSPRFTEGSLGIVLATLIDWLWCLINILELAEERMVRNELTGIVKALVDRSEAANG